MSLLDSQRHRAGALILLLGVGIALAVTEFMAGLFGVAVLYVMSRPVHRRLSTLMPASVSASLVLTGTVLLILLPLAAIIALVVEQAPTTIRSVQDSSMLQRLATMRIGAFDVGAQVVKAGDTILAWVSAQAFGVFGSAARGILNLVIALFGQYYMLLAAEDLWPQFRGYLPFSAGSAETLRRQFYSVSEATLLGIILTALAQGTIVGVGFWVVGLPSPLFWGVITGLASVVPVVGSALVWVPGVLVLLASGQVGAAIGLGVVCGVLASNVDNVIRPAVYKRISNIHPMVTLIGAFAGLKIFGLLGILLGPLLISYFFELLRIYHMEYGPEVVSVPVGAPGVPTLAPVGSAPVETQGSLNTD